MKEWETSPDRIKWYEKMMSTDPIGDPIITSKCTLRYFARRSDNGFLIVSNNGFAWRIYATGPMATVLSGKSKWVRWHDVANIIPKINSQILLKIKVRRKGSLILDKRGNLKINTWKLTIRKNKGEPKAQWRQRLQNFHNIIMEIYNRNKVETDPPTSDSRI